MKGLKISPYLKRTKESLSVYRWVFKNTVPERSKKHLKRMIPFMFLYEAFGMAIPLCFGFIVNAIIKGENHVIFFVLIVVLMILRLILHRKYMIEREYVKGYNESALNNFITNNLLSKSIGQHVRFKEELNQSSMNRARSQIRFLTGLMLFEGITSTYSLVLSFCFLWFLAPFAGFILTIALTLYVFGSLLMNKEVIEKFGPIDKDFKRHNDKLEESWDKSIRILSLGKGKDITDMLDRRYESINDSSRNFWIGFIDKITLKDLINVFSLAIVYGMYMFGDFGKESGSMSVGFLLPLFSWSWNVVNNIWRIGHIEQEFNWCLPTIKKLKHSLEIIPDIVDHNPKILSFSKTPTITFENVTFNHVKEGSVKETIRDLSFSINPGEKVALIGSSGAGKTTITKLFQRAYDPHSGCIRVNGYDLRDVSIKAWNEVIGEIPQQIDIFDGTLRDNLLIAVQTEDHHEYTDEVLQRTMDHFVIDFCREKGLETKVGPNGVWLSGGQQQRVAIAQIALKKEASVYIIDEATSSLDATTEKQVQSGFLKLLKGDKSALVVAHNLSTVRNICNKFVVLRSLEDTPDGESQIEAQGNSFEEIYPNSPILRRLMEDQGLSLENKEKAFA
jgi:ABC-type multidrug transport system fused ATPase/permease subunit